MKYLKSKQFIEYEIIVNYHESIFKSEDKKLAQVVLQSLLTSKKYYNVFMIRHTTTHYALTEEEGD